MPSARDLLLGSLPSSDNAVGPFSDNEKSPHAGAQIGANARKQMIGFAPHGVGSAFNGGYGKSFSYAYLYSIDFAPDYSMLQLTFSGHRVRVFGNMLKSKLDAIEGFREELVEECDPLVYARAVKDGRTAVERLVLEELSG